MKIKVANVIEDARLGGPQNRIVQIAYALRKEVTTTVICPRSNSLSFQELLKEKRINFQLIPMVTPRKNLFRILEYILKFPLEIFFLYSFLKKNKYQIVHISGGSWQYKGLIASVFAGIPTVWHLNDSKMPFIIKRVFLIFSNLADSFICASNRTMDYYENLISRKKFISIIQAPVDTKKFETKEISIKKNKNPIIATVCNVSPIKDLETFIKVAKNIQLAYPNSSFKIVSRIYKSQKKYFYYLKTIIKKINLKEIEFVEDFKDINKFLSKVDLYICTSKAESSPLSVWEALSMGIPVVSTDVGDVPVFVQHNVNGYISPVGDINDLSNNAIKILSENLIAKIFAERSRQVAVNKLDISISAQKHLNHYQKLLREPIG